MQPPGGGPGGDAWRSPGGRLRPGVVKVGCGNKAYRSAIVDHLDWRRYRSSRIPSMAITSGRRAPTALCNGSGARWPVRPSSQATSMLAGPTRFRQFHRRGIFVTVDEHQAS